MGFRQAGTITALQRRCETFEQSMDVVPFPGLRTAVQLVVFGKQIGKLQVRDPLLPPTTPTYSAIFPVLFRSPFWDWTLGDDILRPGKTRNFKLEQLLSSPKPYISLDSITTSSESRCEKGK